MRQLSAALRRAGKPAEALEAAKQAVHGHPGDLKNWLEQADS